MAAFLEPTLRPELHNFAGWMESQLRRNDHKGGWQDMTFGDLLTRLQQELDELDQVLVRDELDVARVVNEAADVANFAMMIADQARHGRGRPANWGA